MEFSELAIQKLLQQFPELSSHIVTFQDLTESSPLLEDGDISVGIFILQTGSKYFYIPIVAKGDAIQPIDSLFDSDEQCFYPLSRGFLNLMVTQGAIRMGKPAKVPSTVSRNPSIYSLVTPPRTGKFVYASSSRLEEFLTTLPNMVKRAVLDKFSNDANIYSALHQLFGLENIVGALTPTPAPVVVVPKPAVQLITEGNGLGNPEVQSILNKGYALTGQNQTTRVAVPGNVYNEGSNRLHELSSADGGCDYDICTTTGDTTAGYLPKRAKYLPQKAVLLRSRNTYENMFVVFGDGTFTIAQKLIAEGEPRKGHAVLRDFFAVNPPATPASVTNQDTFAIFSPELDLIDVYQYPVVMQSEFGTTIIATSMTQINSPKVSINAYKNCTTINCEDPQNIFIPYNTLIAILGDKISADPNYGDSVLETNINTAQRRQEFTTLQALGSAVNLGFDGVEFIVNRSPVGGEPEVMKILVVDEGIDPTTAESFVKRAREEKFVRIYMSKKADIGDSDDVIPSYGEAPLPQQTGFGIDDDFTNNVAQATTTADSSVVESTIIGGLLQVADMKGYIAEYLPDIKDSIDKLGRALFLSRIRMDQLAANHSATEVFTFISNTKNTYKMLGDTYLRLMSMVVETSNSKDEISAGEK